jgi:hypothetical protein
VGDAVEGMQLPIDAADPFAVRPGEPFRIIWFGSHGSPNAPAGIDDILRINRYLEQASRIRSCELNVISNHRAKFETLAEKVPISCRYFEWSDDALMKAFAGANLVVVPITPNPFTKCKSNNRVATALWHGIPTIADRIPAYDELSEFAVLGDWEFGFEQALRFSREMRLRTAAGSVYVRMNFNQQRIAAEWRRAIKVVLSQPQKLTNL